MSEKNFMLFVKLKLKYLQSEDLHVLHNVCAAGVVNHICENFLWYNVSSYLNFLR